jgi:hypothetical protein
MQNTFERRTSEHEVCDLMARPFFLWSLSFHCSTLAFSSQEAVFEQDGGGSCDMWSVYSGTESENALQIVSQVR